MFDYQVAMTSGSGVVIQPVSSSSQILALTMGTFVTRLLAQLNGQTDLPPGPPEVKGGIQSVLWVLLSCGGRNAIRVLSPKSVVRSKRWATFSTCCSRNTKYVDLIVQCAPSWWVRRT